MTLNQTLTTKRLQLNDQRRLFLTALIILSSPVVRKSIRKSILYLGWWRMLRLNTAQYKELGNQQSDKLW